MPFAPSRNNPSQIDLSACCGRALWINLKLISVPEVRKTCSRPYQTYCFTGEIWQANLSWTSMGKCAQRPIGTKQDRWTYPHTLRHIPTYHKLPLTKSRQRTPMSSLPSASSPISVNICHGTPISMNIHYINLGLCDFIARFTETLIQYMNWLIQQVILYAMLMLWLLYIWNYLLYKAGIC